MFDDDKDDFLNPFGDKNKNGYYDAEDRWIHENYFGDDGESETKNSTGHKSSENESSGHKNSSSAGGRSGSLFEIIILIMLAIQPLLLLLVVATSGSGRGAVLFTLGWIVGSFIISVLIQRHSKGKTRIAAMLTAMVFLAVVFVMVIKGYQGFDEYGLATEDLTGNGWQYMFSFFSIPCFWVIGSIFEKR